MLVPTKSAIGTGDGFVCKTSPPGWQMNSTRLQTAGRWKDTRRYICPMTTAQRWMAYALLAFLMVWGLDLIYSIKMHLPISWSNSLGPFQFSQLAYCLLTFVLCRWVWKRILPQRRYALILPALLLLIVIFTVFRFSIEEILYPALFQIKNYSERVTLLYYFLDNIYFAVVYIALGTMVFLLDNQLLQQKRESELQQRNREAELQFLRSQIHPHFLFNTLNNIYSLVYEKSDRAPGAMLQLSALMRYLLYEKKEKVPLEKEWSYIHHFIELQQLRFETPVLVLEEVSGDIHGFEIAPYLIIPFVENAFKHGDFKKGPLQMCLSASAGVLDFEISNPIGHLQKDEAGGIGLDNVRRRLQLLYPEQHELETYSSEERFFVKMSIRYIQAGTVN